VGIAGLFQLALSWGQVSILLFLSMEIKVDSLTKLWLKKDHERSGRRFWKRNVEFHELNISMLWLAFHPFCFFYVSTTGNRVIIYTKFRKKYIYYAYCVMWHSTNNYSYFFQYIFMFHCSIIVQINQYQQKKCKRKWRDECMGYTF
jgi:hypothetical protein